MLKRTWRLAALSSLASVLACAAQAPAPSAPAALQERVPASPPNHQPATLADDLVPNEHGDMVSTKVLSVHFRPDATVSERQTAIDGVDGVVIGGVNLGGSGWYYVEVAGDGTIDTIYEIAAGLNALPYVELAGPYTIFGSD